MNHISPSKAYPMKAFGQKSKSTEELSMEMAFPDMASTLSYVSESEQSNPRSSTGTDSDSSGSMCGLSLMERSGLAVEQLQRSRKQLEEEIEVSPRMAKVEVNRCSYGNNA